MSVWHETAYHGWQTLTASEGELIIRVVPTVGGRIMSLEFHGVELLFQHPELLGKTIHLPDNEPLEEAKTRVGFPLWGGSKVWIAPQHEWFMGSPSVDLDSGAFSCSWEGPSLSLCSPLCRETGLRVTRRLTVTPGGLDLTDTMTNEGGDPIRRGLWEVTMCQHPMVAATPLPVPAWRPYPEEGESVRLFKQVVRATPTGSDIHCEEQGHFKVGALFPAGEAVMTASRPHEGGRLVFERRFQTGGEYAHQANAEIFNAVKFDYLEIEAHSPLTTLAPGESVSLAQQWRFWRT